MAASASLACALDRLKLLHPRTIDLSLDRVQRLLHRLGNPEQCLPPVIHVAGTNGKGSTIAFLKALLNAHGRTTHVYTSPHLVRFSERIVVRDAEIADAHLVDLLAECETANAGEPITFFEITTVAAFLAFARTHADFVLLETGLGGRLDATNVVSFPVLTVLTPISIDHRSFLGETLEQIASEKAGILKRTVAAISARQPSAVATIVERRATALGSPLLMENRCWRVDADGDGFRFLSGTTNWRLPLPALPGSHQLGNAGVAIFAASQILERLRFDAVAHALRHTVWLARLQRLPTGRLAAMMPTGWELWVDGAHNIGAAEVLAEHLRGWRDRPCYLIVGMLQSKDAEVFLRVLAPCVDRMVTVAIPGEGAVHSPQALAGLAAASGVEASPAGGVEAAIQQLVDGERPARVLVCGSLYLAGYVLAQNGSGRG